MVPFNFISLLVSSIVNACYLCIFIHRYDKFCPFYKSVWMMRNIIHFYNLANQVSLTDISVSFAPLDFKPELLLGLRRRLVVSFISVYCNVMNRLWKKELVWMAKR